MQKGVTMKYLYMLKMAPEGDNGSGGGGGASNTDGGAGGGQSGDSGNKGGEGGGAGGSQSISKEDHDRALADLHRFKADAKKNAEQAQLLQDQINQLKKQGMRTAEDFKSLSETQAKELEEKDKTIATLKNGISKTFRSMQVKQEAKALGIKESAMRDLDLLDFSDQVQVVFGDDGTVSVDGAKQAAENLKKTRDHWFQTGKVDNINTGGKGGGNEPAELTSAYMNSLEKTDPKKYKELYPKYVKQIAAKKK